MVVKKITRRKIPKPQIRRKKRIYETQIPPTAKVITGVLNSHGATCYIVGGFTRDAITGGSPKDVDIEVHGMDIDTISHILSQDFVVNYVGKSFGVLKVKRPGDHEDIDVSVPRRDSTGRKPDVSFIVSATPEEAASRRDFTINALMWDTKSQQMVDPYGGLSDINKKVIRAVTPQSFKDDPLRVVRAAQFSSRFGYDIDPETITMAKESTLTELSGERIREEMMKALTKSKNPSKFFYALDDMGQLQYVFPELNALKYIAQDEFHHPEGNVFTHTMHVLDRTPNNIYLRVASLLHDTGKAYTTTNTGGKISAIGHEKYSAEIATNFMKRFKFDNHTIAYVIPIIETHMVPHNMVDSGAKITLARKNALLAKVAHGYQKIMKDPKSAFDKYILLISHAIADAGEEQPYREFLNMPPIAHYTPRVNVESLQEQYSGKALGEAIVNRYINQINTAPQLRKVISKKNRPIIKPKKSKKVTKK
jgi:tRNA nucleotidyltransferase (CCA-adding enzyme)